MRASPLCVMPPARALRQPPSGRSACTTVRCAGTGHRPEGDAAGDVPPPAFELFGTSRCDPRAVGTVPAHMSRFAGDAAARGDGAPKVSVVVPVFDPGPYLDALLHSLLRQTLPEQDFEAIFVDDGSTDGTAQRLDRLAAEHRHLRVLHVAHSGWPGRPRNVGLDAARGTYVFFADADDWLGEEALERLHTAAGRSGADIVMGKVVGHGKALSRSLFVRNADRADVEHDAIHKLLTVHKLFRREMLVAAGLRHPEGHVRLEDQAFVLPAYLAARRIAVVADYPCYHWRVREDRRNISLASPIDGGYWQDVRALLDIVDAPGVPGVLRDELRAEWFLWAILRRLGGAALLRRQEPGRTEMVRDMRRLAAERFGPDVAARLPAAPRVRARLLAAGRLDGLLNLARHEAAIGGEARVRGARWRDGVLRLELEGTLIDVDGRALELHREGDALRLALPAGLPGAEAVRPADRDASADLRHADLRVFVRRREGEEEYVLPASTRPTLNDADGDGVRVTVDAVAALDPARAAAGAPLAAGVYDLFADIRVSGLAVARRLAVRPAEVPPPALVGCDARAIRPFATVHGRLSVDLDETQRPLAAALRPATGDARAVRRARSVTIALRLGFALEVPRREHAATLVLAGGGDRHRRVRVPARVMRLADGSAALLEAGVPLALRARPGAVTPGAWRIAVRLAHRRGPLGLLLEVDRLGRPTIVPGRH